VKQVGKKDSRRCRSLISDPSPTLVKAPRATYTVLPPAVAATLFLFFYFRRHQESVFYIGAKRNFTPSLHLERPKVTVDCVDSNNQANFFSTVVETARRRRTSPPKPEVQPSGADAVCAERNLVHGRTRAGGHPRRQQLFSTPTTQKLEYNAAASERSQALGSISFVLSDGPNGNYSHEKRFRARQGTYPLPDDSEFLDRVESLSRVSPTAAVFTDDVGSITASAFVHQWPRDCMVKRVKPSFSNTYDNKPKNQTVSQLLQFPSTRRHQE